MKNKKFLYFASLFISYQSIIDSCWYLWLPDKMLRKVKHLFSYQDTSKLKEIGIKNIL